MSTSHMGPMAETCSALIGFECNRAATVKASQLFRVPWTLSCSASWSLSHPKSTSNTHLLSPAKCSYAGFTPKVKINTAIGFNSL